MLSVREDRGFTREASQQAVEPLTQHDEPLVKVLNQQGLCYRR